MISATVVDEASMETTLPLVGETREDALQIAELFLRDYEIITRPRSPLNP